MSFEPFAVDLELLLQALAAITLVAGNLIAVAQTNVKRMLAYSSIAHSGYMLAGLAATQPQIAGGLAYAGAHTLLYYGVAYALMNTGAFRDRHAHRAPAQFGGPRCPKGAGVAHHRCWPWQWRCSFSH